MMERTRGRGGVYGGGGIFYFGAANEMEYAKEVNIVDDNNEYAIGNNGDNKPLAEGNDDDNDEYTSATCCAERIKFSVTPA
jgi:hypothetical protein